MISKINKKNRPAIPEHIKLKLWVLSGGRCEFPGCNKYLWRDGLTLSEDNFSHMAHIVAAAPKGPRGNCILSAEMVKDFDNLMLVCFDHSKQVDGKNKENYSVEELQKYKQLHENRIRRQTELKPNATTTVLRFMANIGDRPVKIALSDAHQAILPLFPSDDRGILMDFTNRPGRGGPNFWESFADEIKIRIEKELAEANDRTRPEHISVFALGPIPLLIILGKCIGNSISGDLFQRHRDTENWKWKLEDGNNFEYQIRETKGVDTNNVALVISLSGKVHEDEVYRLFENRPHFYEILIESPNPGFLSQKSRLLTFREIYRSLLSQIRDRHGGGIIVHLFPAIPAPVAVLCGRELLPKSDPQMIIYDNEKDQGGYVPILKIN
jgi:SMODS-associated and fused to various effectors sensor domain